MSGRMSSFFSDDAMMYNADDEPPTPRMPSHPSHSRQNTAEVAPGLVAKPKPMEEEQESSAIHSEPAQPTHSRQVTAEVAPALITRPSERERERSVSPSKVPSGQTTGLSGDFRVSSPPPPSTSDRLQALEQRHIGERPSSASPPPTAGGLAKKASSGFGALLGRMGSIRKARSPPAPRQESRSLAERRNTAQSVASVDTNGGSLATIADGPEGKEGERAARPSLRDQFQSLRKQEEFSGLNGHAIDGDGDRPGIVRTSSDAGVTSPTSPVKENGEIQNDRSLSTPGLLVSPPLNPSLPPGTASGLAAGPAEEPRPVDWDLWQSVVNEGPSAVVKTSGEELNSAIASGIPAAIRGVVWQVLADSKNEELENIYRTLKARGPADAENDAQATSRPGPPSRAGSQNNLNGAAEKAEKESVVSSSRSSIHSTHSTPATSTVASPPPSVQGDEADLRAKLLAEKLKREAATLTKLEKAIKRDMGSRTCYSKYAQAAGLQDGLFGVCKAYALFDEGVGYAQGMNFIAMPLLFNMSEEEAFTLLVRLMSKYDLRSMFTSDMAGLHLRLYQFERLLEDHDPALYVHLKRRHVGPQLYATQWFLTLFAYRFPLQLVLRVYDLVFSEGLTAILKFGLVLLRQNRDALLEMKDMSHLTTFLKEKVFDAYIDKSPSASSLLDSGFFGAVTGGADKELYRADEMVRDACEIGIPDATLTAYTAEWAESQRLAREREAELDSLRSSTGILTSRVKALEERTQTMDAEHVALAGDLVRVKVDNDALLDENEVLRVRVEELQKMVEAQPAEVEGQLREEMERIILRNSEVQNENRALKEEVDGMERELVDVKMLHAQVSLPVPYVFSPVCFD